jgi:hypothetical protein
VARSPRATGQAELVVLVPVLGRPHLLDPLLRSIHASTDVAHEVLLIVSPDDELGASAARRAALHEPNVRTVGTTWPGGSCGDYARKINLGYRTSSAPLMFLGATDLCFHADWFRRAEAARRKHSRVGVVGTNDLGNRRTFTGRHSTHSLVTRVYADEYGTIDERGKVLHEGYPHEYADDELVRTAKRRHAWAHARLAHVEHLHPNWNKAPTDELYDLEDARLERGRVLFQQRQRLWTGRPR